GGMGAAVPQSGGLPPVRSFGNHALSGGNMRPIPTITMAGLVALGSLALSPATKAAPAASSPSSRPMVQAAGSTAPTGVQQPSPIGGDTTRIHSRTMGGVSSTGATLRTTGTTGTTGAGTTGSYSASTRTGVRTAL